MAEPLSAIIASQQRLISEAAEALPHQFNVCTYSFGYIRQAVNLCLTCAVPRGICSSCSIACHTDHEQIELFPKRHFRCDCPTHTMDRPCSLHKTWEMENTENVYGQNFQGKFCRCGRPYDAKQERETMIQCLGCEDWFHESCLNLRQRPTPLESSTVPDLPSSRESQAPQRESEVDDATSDVSSSSLPPPLLSEDDYDALLCRSCVLSNPTLRRWAGTKGAMMVVRDGVDAPWLVIGRPSEDIEVEVINDSDQVVGRSLSAFGLDQPNQSGNKRTLQAARAEESEETRAKRPRTDFAQHADGPSKTPVIGKSPCIAPQQPRKALDVLSAASSDPPNYDLGKGDVFFTDGWRTRWCQCDECITLLRKQPYLLEEEETYEPPEDPDSGFSLEELGMRALQSLPRDRAVDGIRAFNEMRDDLMTYLRPFAREGKVVNETDIRSFFQERLAARQARTQAQDQ